MWPLQVIDDKWMNKIRKSEQVQPLILWPSGNDGSPCRCPQMEAAAADEEEEDDEEEELHFSGQDLMKIRDGVVLLVQSLLRLLQTFPLKDRPQCANNCTQVTNASLWVWFCSRVLPVKGSFFSLGAVAECFLLAGLVGSLSKENDLDRNDIFIYVLQPLRVWAATLRLFCSLQIFSKLLYFEPVIGEPSFTRAQWVFWPRRPSCSRIHPGGQAGIYCSFFTEISRRWRVFLRWLSMACSCFVCQSTETRKK